MAQDLSSSDVINFHLNPLSYTPTPGIPSHPSVGSVRLSPARPFAPPAPRRHRLRGRAGASGAPRRGGIAGDGALRHVRRLLGAACSWTASTPPPSLRPPMIPRASCPRGLRRCSIPTRRRLWPTGSAMWKPGGSGAP